MEQENKTIEQYMKEGRLAIGGFLYSYMLGYLHKYELVEIVKSEYNDDHYALLKPVEVLPYDGKKWRKMLGYDNKRDWCRENTRIETRFCLNAKKCLEESIESLTRHIESSTWQRKHAQNMLEWLKS